MAEFIRGDICKIWIYFEAGRSFHELSGGQRQLVIIARAPPSEANILVLDEPTSSLDLKNQAAILELLYRLARREGLTVVFTTHQPQHAIADDALLMVGERDYAMGPASKVLTERIIVALYGLSITRVVFDHEGEAVETFVPVNAVGRQRK